jgi:chromosome segregation ATPase
MKSSMKSQGYLLLQKSQKTGVRKRLTSMLRQVSANDPRVKGMIALLQAGGPLDEVIKAIDEMVATLKEEEATDLETKERCESDREEDTKSARDSSVEIDDFTDVMTKNSARIAELNGEIEKLEAVIKEANDDLLEAKRAREDEKAAFESSLRDDEAAAGLITQAKDTLANFYKDNELALLQKAAQKGAPPPPPTTPDGGYGGAKGESQGIQTILEMILNDVKEDIEKSKKNEKKAIEEYEKFKKDTEASIEESQKTIEDHKGEIAECEKTIEGTKMERKGAKDSLDSVMEEIKLKAPNCEFMTVNFDTRVKNRQAEIDGLLKAKSILEGAEFGL